MKTGVSLELRNRELDYCRSRVKTYNISFSTDAILGRSRVAHLNGVRSLIAVILRNKGYSYPLIGAIINRDHSDVMHLVNNYESKKIGRLPDYSRVRTLLTTGDSKEEILLLIENHLQEIEKLQKRLQKLEKKCQDNQNN